jgi:hypothetical protein
MPKRPRNKSPVQGNGAEDQPPPPPWDNDPVVRGKVEAARVRNDRAGALALERFEIVLAHAADLYTVKIDMAKDTNYFLAFAHAIGVRGRADSYLLVHLHRHRELATTWAKVEVAKHGASIQSLDWRGFVLQIQGKTAGGSSGGRNGADGDRDDDDSNADTADAEFVKLQGEVHNLRGALDIAKETARQTEREGRIRVEEIKEQRDELEKQRDEALDRVAQLELENAELRQLLKQSEPVIAQANDNDIKALRVARDNPELWHGMKPVPPVTKGRLEKFGWVKVQMVAGMKIPALTEAGKAIVERAEVVSA